MKKIILLILVLISILILLVKFGTKPISTLLGVKENSGIRVLSQPDGATVLVDGVEVGKTLYESNSLEATEHTVTIQNSNASWTGKVKLFGGSVTVVNRELSQDTASSAGEILTLERGKGVTIISNPADSEVEIDGKYYGKTPISQEIASGEHTFNISHSSYLKRSIRAFLPEDYNLTISVDLALSEADLSAINTPVITTTPMVVIKNTPTGFLRVREKASTAGKELAQVKPGDELVLLEEEGNWYKIRLENGTEGYISSTYATKKEE